MTVDDAYDTFFTDHRVESDKKERNLVNVINEDEDSSNNATEQELAEQDVAAFRLQQRQQQQRYGPQQNYNYRNNQTQQQRVNKTKILTLRNKITTLKAILAMANSVHTAKYLIIHKKNAEKE